MRSSVFADVWDPRERKGYDPVGGSGAGRTAGFAATFWIEAGCRAEFLGCSGIPVPRIRRIRGSIVCVLGMPAGLIGCKVFRARGEGGVGAKYYR